MQLNVIPSTNTVEWNACLKRTSIYDIYHTCLYHNLDVSEDARLLVFEENDQIIALPLIFRDVPGTDWRDVTSVYGYAGWIYSQPEFPSCVFDLLKEYMESQRVVSVFSRLHPLIPYSDYFEVGKVVSLNTTTGIDMNLSPEGQFAAYKESVRRSISKSRKSGLSVRCAENQDDLYAFIRVYYDAMNRLNASSVYFFSEAYFEKMWNSKEFSTFILLAELDGNIAGAAMFTVCNGIMQYHLGGVVDSYIHLSPLKILIDEARNIAVSHRCRFFHLGGGYGGQNDQLFIFKSRMTSVRYTFKTLQWIVNPDTYSLLSENKEDSDFFPLYRI